MFIINCDRDNSYCKINDAEVVFNKDDPTIKGDNVFFYFNKNKGVGQVIMLSDNEEKIDEVFEKLVKKTHSRKRKNSTECDENDEPETVEKKRSRKTNPKYNSSSFENLKLFLSKKDDKKKKVVKMDEHKKSAEKILQINIDNEIRKVHQCRKMKEKETNHEQETTDAKIDKKKRTRDVFTDKTLMKDSAGSPSLSRSDRSKLKNNIIISDSSTSECDLNLSSASIDSMYDDSLEDPLAIPELKDNLSSTEKLLVKPSKTEIEKPGLMLLRTQEIDADLFGKDCLDDKMVELVGGINCKSRDYNLAMSASTQASHLDRRLITGVFKSSGYLQPTFPGQAPRAHKSKNPELIKLLNLTAKNAIINFSLQVAQDNDWKNKKGVATTRDELQ